MPPLIPFDSYTTKLRKMVFTSIKRYRIAAQLVFWSFYVLVMFLVGMNFTNIPRLIVFIFFSLFFATLVVYPNYIFLLPILVKDKKPLKYLTGVAILILAVSAFSIFIQNSLAGSFDPRPKWQGFLLRPLVLMILLGISSTWRFLEDWIIAQEKNREQLESELKFLKSQVNPHFLFNSLNNIYSLSYRNHPNATKMIASLSDIMRYLLYDCGTKRVKLKKEARLIENYIKLQNLSQEEALNVDFYEEGISNHHEVAPMLLINFVENAFKHSNILENSEAWININLIIENDVLNFSIRNSYIQSSNQTAGGIGLKNTSRQLELNYPEKHKLEINKEKEAFEVTLKLVLK